MGVFVKMWQVIGQIFNMQFYIYGYRISFMTIFAFCIIVSICTIFILKLIGGD